MDSLLSSIYLDADNTAHHIIYGSSEDNSIGIGSFMSMLNPRNEDKVFYIFNEYRGTNTEKAWMESKTFPYTYDRGSRFILPLHDKQTSFEVIQVNE
ncbi:hypothetical protein [Bacillus thuringiensis]|uniref:hypothetical protein n=1 Tax=Bacillus thuringiensis TaxID=1428 RepID=UPI0021003DB4|nr:hypothetical protein [Bacillus thuringiensis]